MNTIGAAIDRGEIEISAITWEAFSSTYIPICDDCEFMCADRTGTVCTLFDSPYNSVKPCPAVPTSLSSLMSVITSCNLRKETT